MQYIVTGGAGFVGSHLVDHLISKKSDVIVIDDLSTGKYVNSKSKFVKFDLRRQVNLSMPKGAGIFHLAANPNVRESMLNTHEHFDRDVKATFNVMEMARKADSQFVVFLSTSAVYGDPKHTPSKESDLAVPISNYAHFKLIGEGLLEFYARAYGLKTISLRMANIIGKRSDHGVIVDFRKKLSHNPDTLELLGDGTQKKSYIYISDAIDAITVAARKSRAGYSVLNVGSTDNISVREIAAILEKKMGLHPKHIFKDAGGGRGWKGDVKLMQLDISRIKSLGWKPKFNSKQSVERAVDDILSD